MRTSSVISSSRFNESDKARKARSLVAYSFESICSSTPFYRWLMLVRDTLPLPQSSNECVGYLKYKFFPARCDIT